MTQRVIVSWKEVRPLELTNGALEPLLASVDALRAAWEEFAATVSDQEFAEARKRSLRRHAIETGIIERLYDVSWGVTEALVAEGLTREVAEREGELDEDALETIRAQFDALEFLAEAAREERDLTVHFIRSLHQLITRHQFTYEASDSLGRRFEAELRHGQWKLQPNHVERPDGSQLQYTPPEHVEAEMERLVVLFRETASVHALVRAAWLHHQFICVHPFEDGNGRVARALVLLVLLRANYAPLVVDRRRREEYLRDLDLANDGDLEPLVRLFAQLEIVALRSELELPTRMVAVGQTPIDVARGFVERLQGVKLGTDEARAAAVAALASDIQDRVETELESLADGLRDTFLAVDRDALARIARGSPPDEDARFWRAQIIRAARAANFYTNLSEGTWWVRLRLVVLTQELRFVVVTQKVGQGETGVLAITVFSELVPPRDDAEDARAQPISLLDTTPSDSVTLSQTDAIDDRWPEIVELVERTLAAAVAEFARLLG